MNQPHIPKILYVLFLLALVSCQAQATPTATQSVAATPSQTTFSSKIYKLPMSLNLGSNWQVHHDFADLLALSHNQEDWTISFNIVTNAKVADPVSGEQIPFPKDFAPWIKSHPDFRVNEPTEVMVGGIKGLQIDAAPMTSKQKDFLYTKEIKWFLLPSPEEWRFIMLDDVKGERLLIILIASGDKFQVAVEQAQEVLDTVAFSK